jgi:phage baseplate assembly protein W
MVPESREANIDDEKWKNTKTYGIDFEKKRILGKIDGKEAVAQAVYKILNTVRYGFEIYNWNYGCEISSIFGKSGKETEVLAERYVEEALMTDKRIKGIKNFKAEREKNVLRVYFVAESTEGDVEIEGEVNM